MIADQKHVQRTLSRIAGALALTLVCSASTAAAESLYQGPLALAFFPAALLADDADTARFRVQGELLAEARSADGRFALHAQAQHLPSETSADGRFVLKSTNASCNPLDFSIFTDGFEGP